MESRIRSLYTQRIASDQPTAMLIDGEQESEPESEAVVETGRIARVEHEDSASFTEARIECGEKRSKKRRDSRRSQIDFDGGLNCPICMEPWTSDGDHLVCCLPCGHIFGMSCINTWIQRSGKFNYAKCPLCKAQVTVNNVTKLYAAPVIVVDENLKKKQKSLDAENKSLKTEKANLLDIQESLLKELRHLKENPTCKGNVPVEYITRKSHSSVTAEVVQEGKSGHNFSTGVGGWGSLCCDFELKHEMAVDSAHIFDMDSYYQTVILARRVSGMEGTHVLKKIDLIHPNENEDIKLPPNTKDVKDLRVSPCGRLALLASLGETLSIISMGCNNVVISYDLPGPAWSCSWDLNSPHYMYAGLQNGVLLVFDMRQTVRNVQSINGLSSQPIHTIHSFEHKPTLCPGARKLLTASLIGPCVWNTSSAIERKPRHVYITCL